MKNIEDYFRGVNDDPCRINARNGNTQPLIHEETLETIREKTDRMIDNDRGSMELTVTMKDSLLNRYKKKYIKMMIENIIRHTKGIRDCILIPDYSNAGRFHYHGVVIFNKLSSMNTLKRKLTLQIGRTSIAQISYTESYKKYMYKIYDAENPEPFKASLVITSY